jgi:predicted dehydrogenase
MLKIGILGAGHLGRFHIQQSKEVSDFDLIGFYDPDKEKTEKAVKEFGIRSFSSIDELIDAVDVVDIVTPTLSHFECAEKAIKKGRHIFIEKPLTYTLEEADTLVKMVMESGVKAQVGHVERFNPAFTEAQKYNLKPIFIESSRIGQYNPRGTDVSVVLDLMIHDLDIILHLIDSEVKEVRASGVPVISDTPDIANARIEFENGYIANVTASRASVKQERKMRIFQKNAYLSINFMDKKLDVYEISELNGQPENPFALVLDPGNGKTKKQISFSSPKTPEVNAIREELKLFAKAIIENTDTVVTINDGFRSLKLAHQILDEINKTIEKVNLKF